MEFYFIKYNLCRARCQENDGKTKENRPKKGGVSVLEQIIA